MVMNILGSVRKNKNTKTNEKMKSWPTYFRRAFGCWRNHAGNEKQAMLTAFAEHAAFWGDFLA
jgi:hypothetical protein